MARRPGWPYKKEFVCHRCGNCCRGDGYVELTESDLARAANHLGISEDQFIQEYCFRKGDTIQLKDQEDAEQSCIFLDEDDKGLPLCRIHAAKPSQCAGFPFLWRPRDAVEFCDGMRALEGLEPTRRRRMSREKKKESA